MIDHLLQVGAGLCKVGALGEKITVSHWRHESLYGRAYRIDLEQRHAETVVDEEIDAENLEGVRQRLNKARSERACIIQERRRTWKDDPAPTAALNTSATVSRTRSSIAAIRSAPSFSPLC